MPLGRLAQDLLSWFSKSHRRLPWRVLAPGQPNPYLVWLSETLLQQTTVATVIPYFERFRDRFPSLESVALSEEDEVLALWSGLGYYPRARRFRQAAQILWERGRGAVLWPVTVDEWQALPGVGPYTAAAVCAMAFGVPAVPVDGNVRRILTRLWGEPEAKPVQVAKWATLWTGSCHLPWGDFAQALMDLGALVCRPRNPLCEQCPWRGECRAVSLEGLQHPVKIRSAPKPRRVSLALCLLNARGEIYLEKGKNRLFQGLLTVPFVDIAADETAPPPTFRHVLSHFDWWVTVVPISLQTGQSSLSVRNLPPEAQEWLGPTEGIFPYDLRQGDWYTPKMLESAPVSSLLRRILVEVKGRMSGGSARGKP